MALITCPECSSQVSDQAPECIHCGYPLKSQASKAPDLPTPITQRRVIGMLCWKCGYQNSVGNGICGACHAALHARRPESTIDDRYVYEGERPRPLPVPETTREPGQPRGFGSDKGLNDKGLVIALVALLLIGALYFIGNLASQTKSPTTGMVTSTSGTSQPVTAEHVALAQQHFDVAIDYRDAGEMRLAMEEALRATRLRPDWAEAQVLFREARDARDAADLELAGPAAAPQSARPINAGDARSWIGQNRNSVVATLGHAARVTQMSASPSSSGVEADQAAYYPNVAPGVSLNMWYAREHVVLVMVELSPNLSRDQAFAKAGFGPVSRSPSTEAAGIIRWNNLDGYYVQLARDPQNRLFHTVLVRKSTGS